jgi:outer membrane receptor protein involved in Fe transport
MRSGFLLLTAILIANLFTHAFGGELLEKGIIKGEIIDSSSNAPLQFVNIILYHQKDTSFVSGTASGTNGEFILHNVTEGVYLMKVNLLGYMNKYVSGIKIKKDQSAFDAGTILLVKTTLEIKGVQVTGEKPAMELLLDKKVINVSQDLTSSGGTALDVLQNQPSVRVDQDGTVYLRGSSNFTVLINGKPSILQGADALKQISANMVDNIELITNPSSKYDAEGSAGIININLKKQTDYNLSGIANLSSGTRDKYNSNLSLNYNYDKLNITGGIDYKDNSNYNTQDVDRLVYLNTGTIDNLQELKIRDKRRQYSGNAGIDYAINDNNSLSLILSGGNVDVMRSLDSKVSNTDQTGTVYVNNVNSMEMPVNFFNSTLDYTYKFIPDVNDLTFEISYSRVTLPQEQLSYLYTTDATYTFRDPFPPTTKFTNDTKRNEGRTKVNYSYKINSQSTFEMGIQSNFFFRNIDITNRILDINTETFTIDPGLTNNFYFRNNVHAGFVTYTNAIEDFNFEMGLRGEYMDRTLEQNTTGGNFTYTKMDYFPSFSISKKIDDNQLQFSYSRRVNRPNEYILNPFPFYSDKYLTTMGNPHLLPEYINSFELNYQKTFGSVFFSVETYFRNSHNNVNQSFKANDDGSFIVTFENFDMVNSYGAEISSSFSPIQWLKLDPSLTLEGAKNRGYINGLNINSQSSDLAAALNATISFSSSTKMQINGNYYGRQKDAENNDISPFFILTLSMKQDLFDKKLSLTLLARNILTTSYMDLTTTGSNFNGHIQIKQEVPVISLMASYNFNNFKKTGKPVENVEIPAGM